MSEHYFVVTKGTQVGIFLSEKAAKESAAGASRSVVKGFEYLDMAQKYFMKHAAATFDNLRLIGIKKARKPRKRKVYPKIPEKIESDQMSLFGDAVKKEGDEASSYDEGIAIFTDGSFQFGKYSWAFAVYENGKKIYGTAGIGDDAGAAKMRNVAGEIRAAQEAVAWAAGKGIKKYRLFYDYDGVGKWATCKWSANNPYTQAYRDWMEENFPKDAELCKVRGHSGCKGNEEADRLASSVFHSY